MTDRRLSLLDEVMADALDPGYAQQAGQHERSEPDRRAGAGPGQAPRRRPLHLGVVLVLLAAGFVVALAIADVRRDAPDAAAARSELVNRVQDRTASTDELAARVAALRVAVSGERDAQLARTRDGRERAAELSRLELVTGAVPVTGPGVRVTVDDAPPRAGSSAQDQADLGKVQDRDLQLVVNGLWAAGAEAVAVDGYRVTARTAIRSAGESILVDFRPVSAPYVVEAIGDPARLRAAFVDGPAGRGLSTLNASYGIRFSTQSVARMTLPAAASLGDVSGGSSGGAP